MTAATDNVADPLHHALGELDRGDGPPALLVDLSCARHPSSKMNEGTKGLQGGDKDDAVVPV